MFISDFAIRRPIITVVTMIALVVFGIAGLDQLHSTSTDGFAQIIVQFQFGKPTDQATQDVRDAISAVRAQLPTEIVEPII